MIHIRDNILRFYSKCREFRIADKYTDVTVQCEGQSFKCHRLLLASASHYFDTMFNGDFKESKQDAVTLSDIISAKTFAEVLEFIYTGHADVDLDNFYDLLQAGEYFELQGIEDLCVRFVQKNKIMGETILEMFAFAWKTNKKILQHFLGEDIAAQLSVLSKSDKFFAMSIDELYALFDRLLPVNEEAQYAAVIQWIEYDRKQRGQYFAEIFEKYGFLNMSMHYHRFIISNIYNPTTVVPLSGDRSTELHASKTVPREASLYLYVKNVEENVVAIFSVNRSGECSIFDKMSLNGTSNRQWIRSVVVDDFYVHSMQYVRRSSENGHQSFILYPSLDLHSSKSLESPPLIFGDVSMCSLHNSIYAYNHTLARPPIRTSSSASHGFSDEEINRGVYQYHCELGRWFPVPTMQTRVEDACMVSMDNILYLIGGKEARNPDTWTCKEFQAYDPRSGMWQSLQGCYPYHVGADCCVLEGQIYVCGGSRDNGDLVNRYDSTVGCWEHVREMKKRYHNHKVVPFLNRIWAMGNFVDGVPDNQTSIDIYYPDIDCWTTSSKLTRAIQENFSDRNTFTVLDGIVL